MWGYAHDCRCLQSQRHWLSLDLMLQAIVSTQCEFWELNWNPLQVQVGTLFFFFFRFVCWFINFLTWSHYVTKAGFKFINAENTGIYNYIWIYDYIYYLIYLFTWYANCSSLPTPPYTAPPPSITHFTSDKASEKKNAVEEGISKT